MEPKGGRPMSSSEAPSLENQSIIVTGAAAGLGLAAGELLAKRGAAVTLVDLNTAKVEAEAKRMADAGLNVDAQVVDLTDRDEVQGLMDGVAQRYGRIDGLVNLAALYQPCEISEMSVEFWHRIVQSSLDSTFFTCQAALPHMTKAGYGRIVNTSSGVVLMGGAGWGAYCAAKAGVIGFTRVLAREAGPAGITANVIMPGLIATEHALETLDEQAIQVTTAMQCVPRLGEPDDIAHPIAFLLSREAGFISGQTINVGGGMNYL
ncbi:SDR family NAD(P)-dependent oxidoreductase [Mycobacterium sp. E1747]|uniref:SDR family NAD(P)-dependent oxidoreductase n=1 Tax=Mycobacterium sp. E1747 TaxID=1834128 RepID=UPI0009ED2085|nr:SDR family NAD(P)-dependent oxidoreductase [Mycobacterium sp. E1747]